MKSNILIVCYYWPPSSSVAMHRWYFMGKHLADLGNEIHVLVPENPDYPSVDSTIEPLNKVKVVKRPIWEVRKFFSKNTENKKAETDNIFFKDKNSLSAKERLGLWLRGNLFIPDARTPWHFQIRKFLLKYIQQNKIDTIITTGPPHSIHLNGLYLKKRGVDIKWIADFRDPWTTIEYHEKMPMSSFAKKKHLNLEKKVMVSADKVITVSPTWAAEISAIRGDNVDVIYNGYEESTFTDLKPKTNKKFIIAHLGTLRADRNPDNFWEVLHDLNSAMDYEIHLYGNVSNEVKASITENGLSEKTIYFGQVSHEEALTAMTSADLLLLLVNKEKKNSKGRIPAKIFEYLRSGSRILIFQNDDGDVEQIVANVKQAKTTSYHDKKQIKKALQELVVLNLDSETAESCLIFSRERQAVKLLTLIEAS